MTKLASEEIMTEIEAQEPSPSPGPGNRNTGGNTSTPPKDPCNLIYILFKLLGMGCLLPWNFFISVNDFWMHKYRDVGPHMTDPNSTSSQNVTISDQKLSDLQLEWNSSLSIASMIPNVTFLLLNAAFGHHFRTEPRLIVSQVVIILTLIFTTVTAKLNTDSWQTDFLYATLFTVVIINIMVAIFQGGLSGIAGKFPPRYMGSVVQGQALGGIFASGTNVLMLLVGGTSQDSAFYCFVITIGFLSLVLLGYIFMTRTEFFKYYHDGLHCESNDIEDDQLLPEVNEGGPKLPEKINVFRIAADIWVWILSVFLSFLVTLAVFPAITALAKSVHFDDGNAWHKIYFVPVGCFLLFNLGDYGGRLLGSFLHWPGPTKFGSYVILAMSLLRLAFLPLFLFCNISPMNRVNTQVYFHSDAAYLILIALFSVSNGYIGSIAMMFAPKMVSSHHHEVQATAASIMVSFLVLGLAVGAGLSKATILLL